MKQLESLHSHTLFSDGKQTHLQVLQTAEQLDYKVIAFTDHDQVIKPAALKLLQNYTGPVKWLSGIEISADTPKEVEEQNTLHVLGLFVDPTNSELVDFCNQMEVNRLKRMQHMVSRLQGLGFKVSEAECLKQAGHNFVGSPHIVAAIMSHPENLSIVEQLKAEMERAGHHDADIRKRYQYMVKAGPQQYPYGLFMKKSSFKPMPKGNFDSPLPDLDEAVKLIRDAGGVAILAHWFFDKEKLSQAALENILKPGRLDGLETASENTISQVDLSAEFKLTDLLADKYELIRTIGADSHTAADLELFAKSPSGQKSVGQTAKIIEHCKPSLHWSNFDENL